MAARQGPDAVPAGDYLDASRQTQDTANERDHEAILREMRRVVPHLQTGEQQALRPSFHGEAQKMHGTCDLSKPVSAIKTPIASGQVSMPQRGRENKGKRKCR
jgi:hypothetical protein